MPITSASGLVDALRESHILDAAQLEKVERAVKGRDLDSRALARQLLKQGWLTAYQVNQLLQGRGRELVLGPYLLLERLGEGGMGQVFKARHQLMNRTVAVKVIRKERLAHPDAVQRFHREIRLAAQLDHPHLVRAHDAAQVGDTHFLVMEYVEGTDVQLLVAKEGPLPVGRASTYVRQAALGLQHASERGLVHRDIKPSNLQLTSDGRTVKILDVGLARSWAADEVERGGAELTQTCTIMGTPDYIAPEQIADPRRVDVRADLYSLGCTFYFMLAGRPPFASGTWEEKLVCHRKVEPTPIEQLRPDVPPALGAILRKMMAKRPEDRYASPVAVAETLTPFCGSSEQVAVPTVSLTSSPGTHEPNWSLPVDPTLNPGMGPTLLAPAGTPSPGPTVMASASPTASPTPAANSRKLLGWILAGGLVAMTVLMVALLIVLWPRGDEDKKHDNQRADNTRNTSGDDRDQSSKPPAEGPRVLVDEDFRKPYQQKLTIPEGWDEGEAFRIVKANELHALEVGRPTGIHFVKLPPLALSGNFYVEGVYILPFTHKLTVSMENRQRSSLLPVVFNFDGGVMIETDARLPPPGYVNYKPTHFLVKREGKRLRVFLDKEPVADKILEEAGPLDTIRLSMMGGTMGGLTSRLYGVKVGTPGENGQLPPNKDDSRRKRDK